MITIPSLSTAEAEALATAEAFKNNPLTSFLFDEKLWAEIEQQQKSASRTDCSMKGETFGGSIGLSSN